MAKPKIKIPSMQERLADMQSQRGIYKFNKGTGYAGEAARLPRGSIVSIDNASAENIRRYADAIGDFNPRFRDSDYAKATKYGRLVAPPSFVYSVGGPVQGHEEVVEGRPMGYHRNAARGFHSGSEWEYFQPVLEGDRLDYNGLGMIDAKLVKSKFSGEMIVTTSICQYRNQRGEVVALDKSFVHHSPGNEVSTSIGKYDDIAKPYRYSDEEIARIEEDKKGEEMRGSWPRYWEDVAVGDSLGYIVVGPWIIVSFTAWGAARGTKGIRFPLAPGEGIYDPRINASTSLGPHHDYDLARIVGGPGAYDIGQERECLVSILFTNWMGDDGFLWKYSIQFRAFVVHGDTCWYRGKIARKYIDDGKYCVDIEHWGENQRGTRVTVGQATIILPSKVGGQVKYPAARSIEDVFQAKK